MSGDYPERTQVLREACDQPRLGGVLRGQWQEEERQCETSAAARARALRSDRVAHLGRRALVNRLD